MERRESIWVVTQSELGEVEPYIWAYRTQASAWRKAAELIGVAGEFEPTEYQGIVQQFNAEECYRGCEARGDECECEWADEGNRVEVVEVGLAD